MIFKNIVFIVCLFVMSSSFSKVEPAGKVLRGKGLYTWFFIDVYNATLRADKSNELYKYPLSLELSYLRSLSGEDIAKQSAKEILKLGGNKYIVGKWTVEMNKIFPDVNAGDSILANYTPDTGIIFYLNRTKELGKIKDQKFTQAFLDIWLSEKTRDQEFRRQLLGIKN